MQPGIYLAHKPVGPTSFTLVRSFAEQARRAVGTRAKVAHGGTLDPFAHGLLLLLVGPATRLMDLLHPIPKTYVAEVVWGTETDTCDHLGRPVQQGESGALSPTLLDEALSSFLGWTEQTPPATSAKKIGGEPAYRKAHRGETVVMPPSRVYLHEARWIGHELPHRSTLRLTCRGGYYVRALARDLGTRLGCGAHLAALARTAIGPWTDPGPERPSVGVHGSDLLPWQPARALNDHELGAIRQGRTIPTGVVTEPTWQLPEGFPAPAPFVRGVHQARLVALLQAAPEGLRPTHVLGMGA